MHIEFSAHFRAELEGIIEKLKLDAHLFNSFNVEGETVTLSGEREELERILEHDPQELRNPGGNQDEDHLPEILSVLREQFT